MTGYAAYAGNGLRIVLAYLLADYTANHVLTGEDITAELGIACETEATRRDWSGAKSGTGTKLILADTAPMPHPDNIGNHPVREVDMDLNKDSTENLGALRSSTAFNYESIRSLPAIVRQLCFNHDAWVVGGAAKFMCGLSGHPRDWDVIVPLHEWMQASKQFPFGSKINTLGGVKIESDSFEIDVWADDVGRYFQTAGGSFDLIAASPKTQQVCTCTKR